MQRVLLFDRPGRSKCLGPDRTGFVSIEAKRAAQESCMRNNANRAVASFNEDIGEEVCGVDDLVIKQINRPDCQVIPSM